MKKIFLFGGFCFYYLATATAAASAAGINFCSGVWQFGSLGVSIEFKTEEGQRV